MNAAALKVIATSIAGCEVGARPHPLTWNLMGEALACDCSACREHSVRAAFIANARAFLDHMKEL